MIDAALIQQCADPRLSVETVQTFVEEVGATDHLTVTVKSGDRTYAVPRPKTAEEAMALAREYIGQAVVRVGLTQYPAGLGAVDKSQLSMDLFEPCHNLRMGTALFAKIYRIVTKWYGNPRSEAFDDALWSYGTGVFEGERIFYAEDPGDVKLAEPKATESQETGVSSAEATSDEGPSEPPFKSEDPNKASMRIDLSGIKAHNSEPKSTGE
ncbi:TraH family protein [Allorhizobium ampelinum]|uniref:TraH family protein n=1 Tax=Allorhizobium ampelinum TaxID=3025782 RepID=UPI00059FB8EB|nr:TraH family protein [Allorhizobium ampelinum]